MPDDVDEHVATEFHSLVSDLQANDVRRAEEEHRRQAELRAALRRSDPSSGLNAGELLKKLDGDSETDARRAQAELDKIEREAKSAADKAKARQEPLPDGHFPPPPEGE
jgi:hypothetical protein